MSINYHDHSDSDNLILKLCPMFAWKATPKLEDNLIIAMFDQTMILNIKF